MSVESLTRFLRNRRHATDLGKQIREVENKRTAKIVQQRPK